MTTTETASRICHHRTIKVGRLLAAIRRLQQGFAEYDRLVAAGDEQAVRALIVATAGVRIPSAETWQMVAELVARDGRYVA